MEIEKQSPDRIILSLDLAELRIVNNALNEVCNALPRASFDTRMGASLVEAKALLSALNTALPSGD